MEQASCYNVGRKSGGLPGNMYKIILDSCGELTEEMKKDGHFVNVPLTLEIDEQQIIDDDSFEFCSGDDVEMWGAYEIIVSKVIPNFEINLCLKNILTSMEAVCPDKELLNLTVSCLGRSSLRKRNHDWILSKFGVNLPTHRCGQCYKCCHEYLYMVEHGLQEFNDRYYNYCLKRLKANLDKERYVDDTSVEEICERFFVDPKSEYLKRALKVGKI